MLTIWQQAVKAALTRFAARNSTIQIRRDLFLQQELHRIVAETGSAGRTPAQTVSRVMQELRDKDFLFFSSTGVYTLNQVDVHAANEDLPDDVLENAIETGHLTLTDVDTSSNAVAAVRIRRGMNALRRKTLFNYHSRCAVCDTNDERLLIASHIARWADRPEARGLLSNVICFCTLHDKLFEIGYFSLNENLRLIWRNTQHLQAIHIWRQQCTFEFNLPKLKPPDVLFISEHRTRVGL